MQSERELLAAAARGDHRAWNALVDGHIEATWRQALDAGLTAAEAGDVVASVWRNASLHLPDLAREGGLAPYLAIEVAAEAHRSRAMAHRADAIRLRRERQRGRGNAGPWPGRPPDPSGSDPVCRVRRPRV